MFIPKGPLSSEQAEPLMEECREKYSTWKKNKKDIKLGYFSIYKSFCDEKILRDLSGNALKLYIYLGIHAKTDTGESWHSIDRIAEYFGCDKRSISRWFNELEEKRLVARIQKGYHRAANTFLLPY